MSVGIQFRSIDGGMLIQDSDQLLGLENLQVVTERQPTEEESNSLKFALKVCKHVKSNAIVLASGRKTVGIGAGQMSRIDSLKVAIMKMNDICRDRPPCLPPPLVLASDAFFPFRDVVDEAVKVRVSAIIQPGGSVRDCDSIKACNEHKIAMVFTGVRHFRH
jgi:phosphoribosylaminoimidazolecarboxamide formyltransferase/IMP cyclohydrolase